MKPAEINAAAEAAWAASIPHGAVAVATRVHGFNVEIVATRARVNRETWNRWLRAGWLVRLEPDYFMVMRECAEVPA